MEKNADKWIEIAEKIAASSGDEKIRKRIAQETALWKNAKSVLVKLRKEQKKDYEVTVNGKTMVYKKSTIRRKTIISLFGLRDDIRIDVIEKDGQNRRLHNNEKISLTHGVVFKIVK